VGLLNRVAEARHGNDFPKEGKCSTFRQLALLNI